MASKLTTLANQHTALQYDKLSRESLLWLQQKVRNMKNPAQVAASIAREKSRSSSNAVLGGLYFFYYEPKMAATLPWYDIFPLVLVLERYPDSILGINFHYLPVMMRAALLDQLLDYATYNDSNEVQRIRVTYDILASAKRLRAFQPCLKRYLYAQMGCKPLKVEPHEWETAIMLPVEQFQKAKKSTVQMDSVKDITTKKEE